jgi:hypothetical protein
MSESPKPKLSRLEDMMDHAIKVDADMDLVRVLAAMIEAHTENTAKVEREIRSHRAMQAADRMRKAREQG